MTRKQSAGSDGASFDGGSNDSGAPAFEKVLSELEAIIDQLEKGDLPLEQMLVLHARGQQLVAQCAAHLDKAELKLRVLDSRAE